MQIIFTDEAQQVPFNCAEKSGSARQRFAILPDLGEDWLYSDADQDETGADGDIEYCASMENSSVLELERKQWHRLQTLLCLFFLDTVPHDIDSEDENGVIGARLGALLAIHPDFVGILTPEMVASLARDFWAIDEGALLGALSLFPGEYDGLFLRLRSGILDAADRGGIVVIRD